MDDKGNPMECSSHHNGDPLVITDPLDQCFQFGVFHLGSDRVVSQQAAIDRLAAAGIENMAPIVTSKNTFIAPFVNAE